MTTDKKYSVSVVIVNYNGAKLLSECVAALLNASVAEKQIIVVDNGSTGASMELFQRKHQDVKVIALARNRGYAVANNIGIKAGDSEYVLLVNNDTIVSMDFLDGLISCMENDAAVSAVQSSVLTLDSPPKVDSLGSFFTWTGFLYHEKFGASLATLPKSVSCWEVFSAKGACLLLRRSVLQEVGLFDEDFFLYFEETDLCWRMWLKGLKVKVSGRSRVFHRGGATSHGLHSNFVIYQSFRNRITTLLKNLEINSILLIVPIHIAICTLIALQYVAKGRFRNAQAILAAISWNLRNLQKTTQKRAIVQSSRQVSDRDLFRIIVRKTRLKHMISFSRVFWNAWP